MERATRKEKSQQDIEGDFEEFFLDSHNKIKEADKNKILIQTEYKEKKSLIQYYLSEILKAVLNKD